MAFWFDTLSGIERLRVPILVRAAPPPLLLSIIVLGWWDQCLVHRMRRKSEVPCSTDVCTLMILRQSNNLALAKLCSMSMNARNISRLGRDSVAAGFPR